MPPNKPPKGMPPNDSPVPDKSAGDAELKDKEVKQIKELKNGGAKGKAQPKAVAESRAKKRTKKAGSGSPLTQNLLSALALVAAVGATYYLTSKPPPVDPKRAASVTQDGVADQSPTQRKRAASVTQDGTDQLT